MSLEINQLTGGYAHVPVLKEVSFTVPNNQVVGLIGLNGAGKSITLDGVTLQSNPDQYRQKVAYVPETPVLYPELTLKEHLELTMMAYDLNVEETWVKANALLKRFRLDNKLDWFPVHFSKGMRQKVMIVNAFMTNADLFIIDEPFTGLDPLAIHDLLEIIAEKKAQGAAILMSTHILATAQQYADSFVLLNQGRVRTTGTLEELKIEFNMADADLDDIYLQMTKEG